MGVVYRGYDTRLQRPVALKLLVGPSLGRVGLGDLLREGRAASALNHPNIVTVYDIGESEAGRFIVMELVAGRTLRSVIPQDNSVDTVLTLGSQIAKALSAAHPSRNASCS